MNRKQRRATTKLGSPASAKSPDLGEQIRQLLFEAVSHERARKFDDAVRAYRARVGDRRRSRRGLQQSRPGSSGSREDERCLGVLRPRARAHAATFGTIQRNLRNALFFTAPSWRKRSAARPPHGRSACLCTICSVTISTRSRLTRCSSICFSPPPSEMSVSSGC